LAGGTAIAASIALLCAVAPDALVSASRNESAAGSLASTGGAGTQAKPPSKKAIARLGEPWPTPEESAKRRTAADNLPLFQRDEPLRFTIRADFSTINGDRNPESTKEYAGVVEVEAGGAASAPLPVRLSTRGHSRLDARTCAAVPLWLDFTQKDVKGTAFEGHGELKLVTHCRNFDSYDQYVLTEYVAYRLFRLFTPRSFRARLAHVTYVDPDRDKIGEPRYGILIEDYDDVASRLDGRIYPLTKRLFRMLDRDSLTLLTLLQFMIGNTDYSIYGLHNVRLVQDRECRIFPVSYDFDYSGLVNTPYAVADKRFNLESVRERLYRGPCRTPEELETVLAAFRAKKSEALALVDTIPGFEPSRQKYVRKYLGEFFSIAEDPRRAKRALIDRCEKNGM